MFFCFFFNRIYLYFTLLTTFVYFLMTQIVMKNKRRIRNNERKITKINKLQIPVLLGSNTFKDYFKSFEDINQLYFKYQENKNTSNDNFIV